MGSYPTLDRAFKEVGISWESEGLLDRLYALRPGTAQAYAFTIRLQAAGWTREQIEKVFEEARRAAEELRQQGAKTYEEQQRELLEAAAARRAAERQQELERQRELRRIAAELEQHITSRSPRARPRRSDWKTKTVDFLNSCHLLRYKHRARQILLGLTQEHWNSTFTVGDVRRIANCSRTYALKVIGYALRLRLIEVATPGSRGRGHSTLYRFRFAPQTKNVTLSVVDNQSKEYIACATTCGLGKKEKGARAQVVEHQQLPPRRCKRVKYYIETQAPIVYRENVKYRYPFWRDFVWGTRLKLTLKGYSANQTQLITSITANWIVGKPIIRTYEFLTTLIDALALLPPHKRTTRRLLWTMRFHLNLAYHGVRLQPKWFIDITPEKRRKIAQRKALKNQNVQQPQTQEMPRQNQITPDSTVTVWLHTPHTGWSKLGSTRATPKALLALIEPHFPNLNHHSLQRALETPNQPVLIGWQIARIGETATPVYIRIEPE